MIGSRDRGVLDRPVTPDDDNFLSTVGFRPNGIYDASARQRHWPRAALLRSPHHCHEMPNKPAEAGTVAAAMASRGRRSIRLCRAARPDRLELRLLFVI
jgi:hypothetical protein